jgi:hypothetical protein
MRSSRLRILFLDANKLVENTISEIKSSQADKETTRNLRENLNKELQKNTVKPETAKPVVTDDELKARRLGKTGRFGNYRAGDGDC